jgi:methionyl-tRNA formyltransferase
MEVLLLGKDREDFYFQKVLDFLRLHFMDFSCRLAKPGERYPDSLNDWEGDYLLSYLCPWPLPGKLLNRAKMGAINFHPGPPDYPGTGCTNFAIYNQESVYGVTCHFMVPAVDSGRIIDVKRFAILENDTVYSLTQRCYAYMLVQFYEIMTCIQKAEPLPICDETWTRPAYQRKELNDLKKLDLSMSDDEIKRRIKASAYPGTPGAYFTIAGEIFEHRPE